MVSAFSFGIRQNEQKKEADKAAEVEKAEFFCEINTKNSEKILITEKETIPAIKRIQAAVL